MQTCAHLAEATKHHPFELSHREVVANGAHGNARGTVSRKTVDAGGDGRKGDAAEAVLCGDFQRAAIAARQESIFVISTSAPYRG